MQTKLKRQTEKINNEPPLFVVVARQSSPGRMKTNRFQPTGLGGFYIHKPILLHCERGISTIYVTETATAREVCLGYNHRLALGAANMTRSSDANLLCQEVT